MVVHAQNPKLRRRWRQEEFKASLGYVVVRVSCYLRKQ